MRFGEGRIIPLPDPRRNPGPASRIIGPMPALAATFPETISPYIVLMLIGFAVGIFGHVTRSRLIVGLGIAMIFLATLLLPLALIATEEEPPSKPGIYAPGTR